jgi:hypothetical protein
MARQKPDIYSPASRTGIENPENMWILLSDLILTSENTKLWLMSERYTKKFLPLVTVNILTQAIQVYRSMMQLFAAILIVSSCRKAGPFMARCLCLA